jgi:hypothetical protein
MFSAVVEEIMVIHAAAQEIASEAVREYTTE